MSDQGDNPPAGAVVPAEDSAAPPAATEPQRPVDDRYFVGFWSDLPNFGCPHCSHKTPLGPEAIEEHIYDDHPDLGDFDDGKN